jgi:multidrug efflux pump subunit AcrB
VPLHPGRLRVEDVEKIDLIGEQNQKIYIELSHRKLATLGITPRQIFEDIARQNALMPSGKIDTDSDRIYVRVDGAFDAVQSINEVPIHSNGKILRLGDIAEVHRGYQDPPDFVVRYNGKPSVALGIVMRQVDVVIALSLARPRSAWEVSGHGGVDHEATTEVKKRIGLQVQRG